MKLVDVDVDAAPDHLAPAQASVVPDQVIDPPAITNVTLRHTDIYLHLHLLHLLHLHPYDYSYIAASGAPLYSIYPFHPMLAMLFPYT